MEDTASTLDPAVAARLAELEELVVAQRAALDERSAALDEERAARVSAEAERDRLREAYEALTREVELARRRLVVAKAERIDTTQLELEFAAKLAELDKLSRNAEEEIGEKPAGDRKRKKKPRGRRDLGQLDLPEERVEIPDPLLDGKAARIGSEDSFAVRWKRAGFVRVVFARIKYDARKPATTTEATTVAPATPAETSVDASASEALVSTVACTREELTALVASDPRTAGAVIVTAPMPPRLIERSYATPSLLAHIASDKFCDGLPLHRQEDRFARLGVPIDRGTMCRWLEEVGAASGATIVEAMRKEALASAHYVIDNWQRLTRFRDDPRIPLDNNATERGIRGPVVGRKNHHGSKSKRGTQVAARLYTLIETAKLHDIDPAAYLVEAVRAGRRGEVLLPWQRGPHTVESLS